MAGKIQSFFVLLVFLLLAIAYIFFWYWINLKINNLLRNWLCGSPYCNKLFDIFRFLIVWGFRFQLVFIVLAFISGVFSYLTGKDPWWIKKEKKKKKKA